MLAAGIDVATVAKYHGHDPRETLATYSHVRNDALVTAAATLSAVYG
jgi:site-specific recombinase XerD